MRTDWKELSSRLRKALSMPTKITNWTYRHGNMGEDFEAVMTEYGIQIELPDGSGRNIHSSEFKRVYDIWDGYSHGRIPRKEIVQGMRIVNSKYIISILHQFEHLM